MVPFVRPGTASLAALRAKPEGTAEMMLGGTDARFVYDLSDRVYRFSTIYAREDHHVHAANEFTGVEELADSIDFYMELLTRYGETAK